METITAYRRNADGTLDIIECFRDDRGVGDGYSVWERTGESTSLSGWPDEGLADVYTTDGGVEIIVPRSAD